MPNLTITRLRKSITPQPNGCWNWNNAPSSTTGYAQVSINGKLVLVHRAVYEELVTDIPAGLQLDHLCHNRVCVNPDHLDAVTPQVNNARSSSPSAHNLLKTHCDRGHLLGGSNLYMKPNGARNCRTCRGNAMHRYQKRLGGRDVA